MGSKMPLIRLFYRHHANYTDVSGEVIKKAEAWVQEYLEGWVAKGKMTTDKPGTILAILATNSFTIGGVDPA